MSVRPPKCKTCGKEEWRHTCGDATIAKARKGSPLVNVPKSPAPIAQPDVHPGPLALPTPAASVETGILAAFTKAQKRKEYLKLKARERRARQKADGA